MKFDNDGFKVYGDVTFRGMCPTEVNEQRAFFSWIRREFPEYGAIATHIRNEGVRSYGQATMHKLDGMVKGASDIIIPCSPPFVCEVKRRDHTKSKWQTGQQEYLQSTTSLGAFACVALGFEAAKAAFLDYLKENSDV